ncbi:hypothetical protein [Kitasatospora sp. NPDC048407]|uniref:hypothetical protein n=1 Tax=Kitasatospora sp. NPDC048407 TaxID=3364051 RepID=UPI00371424F8
MTSFRTHRARVHDDRLPVHRRHSALRTCVTEFAPYGFRATYHHLTLSARIPRRLEADPDSLLRAVEELHEARLLLRAQVEKFEERRRTEKRAGRRAVPNPQPWWLQGRGSELSIWYDDPFRHPPLRLAAYVRRQNALMDGAELPGCRACGYEGAPRSRSTGHGWIDQCGQCSAVLAPCPCERRHPLVPTVANGWPAIWRRAHMGDDGRPNPHWPAS